MLESEAFQEVAWKGNQQELVVEEEEALAEALQYEDAWQQILVVEAT